MSRGWALGTKAFKRAVVEAEQRRKTDLFIGEKDHAEVEGATSAVNRNVASPFAGEKIGPPMLPEEDIKD